MCAVIGARRIHIESETMITVRCTFGREFSLLFVPCVCVCAGIRRILPLLAEVICSMAVSFVIVLVRFFSRFLYVYCFR